MRGLSLAALALALALALVGLPAISATAVHADELRQPVSLRGVNLGIRLQSLRNAKYPDPDKYNAKLVCSGDDTSRLGKDYEFDINVYGVLGKAGVKVCKYYAKMTGQYFSTWFDAGIWIADIGNLPTSFYFTPNESDNDTAERLYMISVGGNEDYYQSLIGALTSKYGSPHERSTSSIQNKAGTYFNSELLSWSSDFARIKLEQRSGRIDTWLLTYTDIPLSKIVERKVINAEKKAAEKL